MISVSPHSHVESRLTGSSIPSMISRAKELGRSYFAYTDNNHLSSALKTYKLVKEAGMKPILGIEVFFKDAMCPIVSGTDADRCRYFCCTIYAEDQIAFQEICKIASKTDFTTIVIREEVQNLWTWKELEHLSKFNVRLLLSGPHCLVGKALLASTEELAEKVLMKAKGLFGDKLSVALMCEKWAKKYTSLVKIEYTDGTHDSLLASDIVTTNKARKIKASDLLSRSGHNEIQSKITNSTYFEVNKKVLNISEHKGFLPLPVDATLEINKFLLEMSKKHQIQVLVTDYAYYSTSKDRITQTMMLGGSEKLHSSLHMRSEEEFVEYLQKVMGMSLNPAVELLMGNNEWAKNFYNFELKYEWRLADSGSNPLQQCMDIIKSKGLMRWDDKIWTARLREEISVIAKNGILDLSPYFLPIHDVINHYEENGRLTGPGRGSSAGSLIAYLMGITKINPFQYDLSFNRFYSIDRIKANKLSDIDSDLESRDLLVGEDGKSGYLYNRWGTKAAQVSTRGKMRLKSSIKDVNRYFNNGSVEKEIESITKSLPDAGQGITDEQFLFGFEDDGAHIEGLIETSEILQKYVEARPKEWSVVRESLGITRSFGRHACAFLIADKPISDFVPIRDGYVTQYEASACEDSGLVKYDFLIISQLKDLRICMDLINKKNVEKNKVGYFTHKGKLTYIWDLPEDADVYKSIWNGGTEACFQISTPGMTNFVKEIMPQNMEDTSLILSLQRPGPLDYVIKETGRNMAQEYVYRRNGNSYEDIPVLKELIPETHSVLVYQEQVTKVAKLLAGFSGSAAENLREAIGKKKKSTILKIKPDFISGCLASGKVTEEEAQQLWERIVTFGRYAFNKSHGISYSYITYACMFLKHHYNLEFWAAILNNAKQNEITGKLWPHVKHLLAPPDINLSSDEMEIDYANHKIRAKLGVIRGMGAATIDPIVAGRPYKDIRDFVNRDVAGPSLSRKLIHVGVLDSLFPPKSSLLDMLQTFEDALEANKYNQKVAKAAEEGKLIKQTQPKQGEIPELYLVIEQDPMRNAAVKKSILPSLIVGLYDLGRHHSKCIVGKSLPSKIMTAYDGSEVLLVTGEMLQRLDEMPEEAMVKDVCVAVTCFVVDTEIFDYKKNTKQALKILMDTDGYVKEHVLWPNYYTQELVYPKELKKGQICTVFMKKRAGDGKPATITEIVIEA